MINDAIKMGIDKLRRVRRRAGFFDKVKKAAKSATKAVAKTAQSATKAVGSAVQSAAKAAKGAAKVAGAMATQLQAVAVKLDGLTGGKLSTALENMACPILAKTVFGLIKTALTAMV